MQLLQFGVEVQWQVIAGELQLQLRRTCATCPLAIDGACAVHHVHAVLPFPLDGDLKGMPGRSTKVLDNPDVVDALAGVRSASRSLAVSAPQARLLGSAVIPIITSLYSGVRRLST